ncbi:hypothetical protein SRHO_G00075920 [Serrasalmus rhombeus]
MPSDLVSDQGPQFASFFWKAFCWLMGASVSLSSGFHQESNGQTEQVNQDLAQTLQCLTSTNPSSWAERGARAWGSCSRAVHTALMEGMAEGPCFPPDHHRGQKAGGRPQEASGTHLQARPAGLALSQGSSTPYGVQKAGS